jgi:hypothetical protein
MMNFPVSRVDRHDPLHVLVVLLALGALGVWLFLRA